jgi:hypothetical protein
MASFLGQRYVAYADQERALAEASLLRGVMTDGSARYISTTFVPNEEWVFDLFEADSADAVAGAYGIAGVTYERIAEAIHLNEADTGR